jgi:hypothetical protein
MGVGPFFAHARQWFSLLSLFACWLSAPMSTLRWSLVLLLILVGGAPPVAWGQASDSLAQASDSVEAPPAVAQRIAAAFSEGDANRLLTPSADRIEISLFGARTFYSSAQALYVLREFFRSHAPRRFQVRDVMETGTSCFVQGEYEQARRARRLQVYVRLGQAEGADLWQLHEIRIEGPPK